MAGQTIINADNLQLQMLESWYSYRAFGGAEGLPGLSAVQHLGGIAGPGNLDRMTIAVGKRKASLPTSHHVMQMLLTSLQDYSAATRIFRRPMCQERLIACRSAGKHVAGRTLYPEHTRDPSTNGILD